MTSAQHCVTRGADGAGVLLRGVGNNINISSVYNQIWDQTNSNTAAATSIGCVRLKQAKFVSSQFPTLSELFSKFKVK